MEHSESDRLAVVDLRREFLVPSRSERLLFGARSSHVDVVNVYGDVGVDCLVAHVESGGVSCGLQFIRLTNFHLHRSVEKHHFALFIPGFIQAREVIGHSGKPWLEIEVRIVYK